MSNKYLTLKTYIEQTKKYSILYKIHQIKLNSLLNKKYIIHQI